MPITYDIEQDPLYQRGAKQNTLEIAANMKKAGVPVEDISKFTGLTKEQIDQLK